MDTNVKSHAKSNVIKRLILFVSQIIEELKRVVYPTWKEVKTYSVVVVVFLIIVMAFISAIDATGGKLIMVLFEN
jgi:preprotein translocase subunit SecE